MFANPEGFSTPLLRFKKMWKVFQKCIVAIGKSMLPRHFIFKLSRCFSPFGNSNMARHNQNSQTLHLEVSC